MAKTPHDSDVEFVKALAKVLDSNNLTELEVKREYGEDDSLTVRVSKQMQTVMAASVAPAAAPAPIAAPSAAPQAAAAAPEGVSDSEPDPSQHPGALNSPMVGTCYLQSEPGSPSFVSVGDKVSEGQTVLIIEAMKTMNQIPSPRAGTVKRILVEDGSPVEFGAPLMIIE